ncbi:MAG: hypothetical protein RLZZ461_688 [Planctomycetota bacterium]|jgi:cation:H+ antiporter
MLAASGILILALALLMGGAEFLVRGASRLARRLGLSPFTIGVTVVGFGTSTPELAASIASARSGHGEIALGNVVGSNIMNIALVLGVCALVRAIPVSRQQLKWEVWTTILVSTLPFLALLNHDTLDQTLGIPMLAGLIAFLWWSIRRGGESEPSNGEEPATGEAITSHVRRPVGKVLPLFEMFAMIVVGLVMLAMGANWLVESATTIARGLGVSEMVIGLTIVAGGTSAPELATSLIAIRRGNADLGVGNILGSCIFNILGILGITAIVAPIEIPSEAFSFDLPVMLVTAILCWPFMLDDLQIDKREGAILTAVFVIYTVMLFAGWPFPADRGKPLGGGSTTSAVSPIEPDDYRTAASIQAPPSTSSPS